MSSVDAPELDSSYIEHLEKISTVWNNKKNLSSQELSGLTPFVNLYAILDEKESGQSSLLKQLDSDPIYFNKYDFKTNDIIQSGSNFVAIDVAKLQSQIAEFETDRNQKGGVGLTSLEVRRSTSEAFVVKYDLKLVITDSRLINSNVLLSKLLTLNSLFVITFGWEGFEINNSEGINSVKRPINNRNNGKVELTLNKEDKANGYWDWSAVKLYNFNFNVTQEGHLEVSLGFVSAETAHLQFGKTRNISNRVLSAIKRPDFQNNNNITNSSVIGPIAGFESYFYDKPIQGQNISTDGIGTDGNGRATNPGFLLESWKEEWTGDFNVAIENPSAGEGSTKKFIDGVEILYQDGEQVVRPQSGFRDIGRMDQSPWVYDEVNSEGRLVKTPRYAENGRGYFLRNLEIDLTNVKLVNSESEAFFYNSTAGVSYAGQLVEAVRSSAANTTAVNNPASIKYSTSTPYDNNLLEKIKIQNQPPPFSSEVARQDALRPVAITNLQYKKYTESIKQDIVFGKDIIESIFNLDQNNEFFSINKDTIFQGNSRTDSNTISIIQDKIRNGTIIFQSQSIKNNEGEESEDPAEPSVDVEQSSFDINLVEPRNLRIPLVDLGEYIYSNYGYTPSRNDYNTDDDYIDELLGWVYDGSADDPLANLFNDYWDSVTRSYEYRFAKSVKIGIPTGSIIFQSYFLQNARDFTFNLATGAAVGPNNEAIDLGEEIQQLYNLLELSDFNAAAASEAVSINVSRRESIPTCYYLGAILESIIKVVNDDFGEGSKVRFLYQKVTDSIKNEYAKIKFNVNRLQNNNKNIQISISNIIETVFDLPVDYATVDNMLSDRNLNNSSINVLLKDILMAVNAGIMKSMPPLELSFRKRSDIGESVYEIYVLSQNIDGFNTQLINSYQAGRYVLNSTSDGSTIDLNFGEKNSLVQSFNVASKIDPLTYASFRMPTSFGLTSINLRGILNQIHNKNGESFIETLLRSAEKGEGVLFDNIVNTTATGGVQDRIDAIKNYINSEDSEFTEETNNDITTLILGDPDSFLSFISESVVGGENALNPNIVSDLLLNFLLNIDATLHGITGVYLFDPIIVNNFVAQTGGIYIVNSVKETITPGDFKSVFNLKLHTPFDGITSTSDVYVPPEADAVPQKPDTRSWPSRQHPLNAGIVLYYDPTDTRPWAFKEYYDINGNRIHTANGREFFNTDEEYDQAIESFRQSNIG